jgi:hypothetical protein
MVGTTGDMLLVQCELNALSHLFRDCTKFFHGTGGGRLDSKNISNSLIE